jgi:DNA-directed RNA polymerase subunit RPC12/RpoP
MRDESYKIELFVFPDGTPVEMIVFDPAVRRCRTATRPAPAVQSQNASAARQAPSPCRAPAPPQEDPEAYTCPVCGSRLVYPVDWERSGNAAWTLQLRCPECETRREVTLGRASVEHFNRELYQGAQAMAREAERLSRRNFEDEVERIAVALERDLIQPMDF